MDFVEQMQRYAARTTQAAPLAVRSASGR
jgi:hypothetical protein